MNHATKITKLRAYDSDDNGESLSKVKLKIWNFWGMSFCFISIIREVNLIMKI